MESETELVTPPTHKPRSGVYSLAATVLLSMVILSACHGLFIDVEVRSGFKTYGFWHAAAPCRIESLLLNVRACWFWKEFVTLDWVSGTEVRIKQYYGLDYDSWWAGNEEHFPQFPAGIFHGFYFAVDGTDGDVVRIDEHVCDPFVGPTAHAHALDFTAQYAPSEFPSVVQEVNFGPASVDCLVPGTNTWIAETTFLVPQ